VPRREGREKGLLHTRRRETRSHSLCLPQVGRCTDSRRDKNKIKKEEGNSLVRSELSTHPTFKSPRAGSEMGAENRRTPFTEEGAKDREHAGNYDGFGPGGDGGSGGRGERTAHNWQSGSHTPYGIPKYGIIPMKGLIIGIRPANKLGGHP